MGGESCCRKDGEEVGFEAEAGFEDAVAGSVAWVEEDWAAMKSRKIFSLPSWERGVACRAGEERASPSLRSRREGICAVAMSLSDLVEGGAGSSFRAFLDGFRAR